MEHGKDFTQLKRSANIMDGVNQFVCIIQILFYVKKLVQGPQSVYQQVYPPSTDSTAPVVNDEASLAK